MIETFLFVRLGEGDVCRNVVWKLQKFKSLYLLNRFNEVCKILAYGLNPLQIL